jgi:hypothetical protein
VEQIYITFPHRSAEHAFSEQRLAVYIERRQFKRMLQTEMVVESLGRGELPRAPLAYEHQVWTFNWIGSGLSFPEPFNSILENPAYGRHRLSHIGFSRTICNACDNKL